MSDKPSKKKFNIAMLAYTALLLGAIGLIIKFIFKEDILAMVVNCLLFIVTAIVAYPITKDGKKFFNSFYKISYLVLLIVVAIFIFIPFGQWLFGLF